MQSIKTAIFQAALQPEMQRPAITKNRVCLLQKNVNSLCKASKTNKLLQRFDLNSLSIYG